MRISSSAAVVIMMRAGGGGDGGNVGNACRPTMEEAKEAMPGNPEARQGQDRE